MTRTTCLLATLLILSTSAAHAQQTLLGAAVRSRPDFEGSRDQVTDVIPVIRYYGQPWFARTTQGVLEAGARSELDKNFWVGAQVAYEPEFDPADLGAGASVGLHMEWDRRFGAVPVNFLLRARQHLDTDFGGQADLRVTAGLYAGAGALAGVFGQATWGTENAVASRYGAPDSGLLFVSFGLLGSYDLGPRWVLVGSFELRQLYDAARESALAEETSGYHATLGIAYRFPR
jgi:outer membrane scaffolding protein for murein synthesis (MipA/OmpV family)